MADRSSAGTSEIAQGLDWVNTHQPLTLAKPAGKGHELGRLVINQVNIAVARAYSSAGPLLTMKNRSR